MTLLLLLSTLLRFLDGAYIETYRLTHIIHSIFLTALLDHCEVFGWFINRLIWFYLKTFWEHVDPLSIVMEVRHRVRIDILKSEHNTVLYFWLFKLSIWIEDLSKSSILLWLTQIFHCVDDFVVLLLFGKMYLVGYLAIVILSGWINIIRAYWLTVQLLCWDIGWSYE